MRKIVSAALLFSGAFAGGYVANRAIPAVHAQNLPAQSYKGTSFTVVDGQGRVQATLASGFNGAELTLTDQGSPRVTISNSGIVVKDRTGRTVWVSPKSGTMPAVE
jgi:hypothetical protein